MKVFCVIPAFNERDNLTPLIKKLHHQLSAQKITFKIFFVIQGNDGSRQILEKLKKKYKDKLDFVYFPKALGIGNAYREGFKHIGRKYTHILTLDADLNHDPKELSKFFWLAKKSNADMIIGSRFIKKGRFNDKRIWKKLTSFLVNFFITKLLKIKVHDITSGYRLIKYEVIDKIKNELREKGYPCYMEFALLVHKYGFKIKEVPITYKPRVWGKSKMKKWRTFLDYLFFFVKNLIS